MGKGTRLMDKEQTIGAIIKLNGLRKQRGYVKTQSQYDALSDQIMDLNTKIQQEGDKTQFYRIADI
jgi:hypothetical protein